MHWTIWLFVLFIFLFSDNAKAYEKIWILGDNFVRASYSQYFQNAFNPDGKVGYIRAHYDITGFYKKSIGKHREVVNIFSRLRNALVEGINEQITFPKAIIMIIDDDILDEIDHYKEGISVILGRVLEWLGNQFHRIITAHKEKLPSKARKFKFPMVLWCYIPLHDIYGHYNDFKEKYNRVVKNVTSLFREMDFLILESWDRKDLSYFSQGCMNATGLATYWMAINDAFEKWDRVQMSATFAVGNTTKNTRYVDGDKPFNQWKGKNCIVKTHYREWNDHFHWKASETRYKLPAISDKNTSHRDYHH